LLELASIAVAFLNQACEVPDVIDVSVGDRFGEQVVVISIPTSAEHDKVKSLLPADGVEYTLHIMPVFGLGSFTGDSRETKEILSLVHVSPYNIYGTPDNKKLEGLVEVVEAREAEVWASMTPQEKRVAIDTEVSRQRSAGRPSFGNCWSRP